MSDSIYFYSALNQFQCLQMVNTCNTILQTVAMVAAGWRQLMGVLSEHYPVFPSKGWWKRFTRGPSKSAPWPQSGCSTICEQRWTCCQWCLVSADDSCYLPGRLVITWIL